MKKAINSAVAAVPAIIVSLVFLAMTVVEYLASYAAIKFFLGSHFVQLVAIALLFLLYLFRLDIFAAILGFYGAWKIWQWPMFGAALFSIVFAALSYAVNYGLKSGLRTRFYRRQWGDDVVGASAAARGKPPVIIDQDMSKPQPAAGVAPETPVDVNQPPSITRQSTTTTVDHTVDHRVDTTEEDSQ
jgi:hypothetical protein